MKIPLSFSKCIFDTEGAIIVIIQSIYNFPMESFYKKH